MNEEKPPRPLRRFLVQATIGLVVFAGAAVLLIMRYGPWVKACQEMDAIASDPLRLRTLNGIPESWESVATDDPPISVGFATFALPEHERFVAETKGGMLELRDGETRVIMLPPYETTLPAADSTDAQHQLDAVRIVFKTNGELFRLSKGEVEHYMGLVDLKAYNHFNERGIAILETRTALVVLHLGELGSPTMIHAIAMSKDSPMMSGLYFDSKSQEQSVALAREVASTIRYSGHSGVTMAEMLDALKGWLPVESIHDLNAPSRSGAPGHRK